MHRKERPVLSLNTPEYRESYRFSVNRFIRGSREIQVFLLFVTIDYIGCRKLHWSLKYQGYTKADLKYVKTLGHGSSGSVALYYDTKLEKNVAVKVFFLSYFLTYRRYLSVTGQTESNSFTRTIASRIFTIRNSDSIIIC